VAVLTHRFWQRTLDGDPSVVGRTIRLGTRPATVVGVLEPSVPYPVETEIIANVVTSPHHLSATMVTQRTHRMTEVFGRLAPGATIDAARAELAAVHAAMTHAHPEAYPPNAGVQVSARPIGEQISARARPMLIGLLAAAGLGFVIACANVANLSLARSVRRESELAVRAALGASPGALRRTLLGESLVLCGAGALLGVLIARPLVTVVGRYASRFSVRALDATLDASLLWQGAGLAMAAALVLAFVPRLPTSRAPAGLGLASGSGRITPGTNRRLRVFAITQIALSFVLLAGAGMLLTSLIALQNADTGYEMRRVLAIDVPMALETPGAQAIAFAERVTGRVEALPGVRRVAVGNVVPWRDAGSFGAGVPFGAEGHTPANGDATPHARVRIVTPGFFAALGVPILAGRDFSGADGSDGERVVIVSRSVARRLFSDGHAIGRRLWWTDPVFGRRDLRRIVGVVADVDDERVVAAEAFTIYHPFRQLPYGGRLFVQAAGDPYALVAPVTGIIRELAADQPVERAATLADVRAEVIAPERLNAFVVAGFAGVALLVAVVGIAGLLAFTVSARTREFGVHLAMGLARRRLLLRVLEEGAVIVVAGLLAGAAAGYATGRTAAGYLEMARLPDALPVLGAAAVLAGAALLASLLPAARASRLDVMEALRSE
jgi:predicted permease